MFHSTSLYTAEKERLMKIRMTGLNLVTGLILALLAFLQVSHSETFQAVATKTDVVASLGSDAELSCELTPITNAENLEIRWFRTTFRPYVHLYMEQKNHYVNQMEEFKGRTELLTQDLKSGKATLRIDSITMSDEGQYGCYFATDLQQSEARMTLKVTAVGSNPTLWIGDYKNGQVTINCESSGWYPKPAITWRDNIGNSVESSDEIRPEAHTGLFYVKSSIHTNSHSRMSCHISNGLIQGEEVSVQVGENLYTRVDRYGTSRFVILAACLAVFVTVFVFMCLMLSNAKKRNQKHKQEAKIHQENAEKHEAEARRNWTEMEKRQKEAQDHEESSRNHEKESKQNFEELKKLLEDLRSTQDKLKKQEEESISTREAMYILNCCINATKVSLTLDKEAAHPLLDVSEDGKSVSRKKDPDSSPTSMENIKPFVLAKEVFTSGRHVWEVVLPDQFCSVGVVIDAMLSKKNGIVDPLERILKVEMDKDLCEPFPSSDSIKLQVYLDYEGGTLAVYRRDIMKCVTIRNYFTGKVRPYFEVLSRRPVQL